MHRLSQLDINEKGFVFDPNSGESFTTNSTGRLILNGLRENKSPETIAQALHDEYGVTLDEAEKDVSDFKARLRIYKLVETERK